MKPLHVRIRGFKGIRDGLGLDEIELDLSHYGSGLVALAGPNGIGKTTLLESLSPFRVLPSRISGDSYTGFSFFEHLCLPDALRDLEWEFGGERYRTQLIFRVNGRRKAEAYLHRWSGSAWVPVSTQDGVCSDGKAETYDACLTSLLGSADTFFTSNFSAQGKRNFADYRPGEIKELLSDLLRLDDVRRYGQRAGETSKLLNAALGSERAQHGSLDSEAAALQGSLEKLGNVDELVACAERDRQVAQDRLSMAQAELAQARTVAAAAAGIETRRRTLEASLLEVERRATERLTELAASEKETRAHVERIRERHGAAAQEARSRLERLAAESEELNRVVSARDAIHRATRRLGLARKVGDERARRVARIAALRETVRDTQARRRRVEDAVAAAEREAGQATLRAADLRRRFQLTSEVPCVGTDFQGRCKLLGDAHAAKPLIPSADSEIARIAECRASLSTELTEYRLAIENAEGELANLRDEERKAKLTQVRRTYLESLVAAADELARAERRASAVAIELADASRAASEAANSDEGGEEIRRCNASVLETQSRVAQVSSDRDRETARIRRELAELPPGADKSAVANREVSCSRASQRVREADVQYVEAIRAQENARRIAAALSSIRVRQAKSVARRQRLENEVSCWAMLQKACSNDGIIALAIDDAGPTLAELTNTLLRACHGQRFSVAIRTEVQTAKGETREGFDIVVHDADSGSMKSVAMMSGGQKTIVDLCLTRAIALYLARNSGRRYDALFSDEADGPLDIDNKRMFMAMKREVLRLGGYDVEYFITQTPELVAMADHVIDVAAMRSRPRVDA